MPNGLEWTVVAVDEDAWPEVQAENEFNDAPLEGNRMLIVRFHVRNVEGGPEPVDVSDFGLSLVGSSNKVITPFADESRCGVIPDGLSARLFENGETEGNVCWQVPTTERDLMVLLETLGGSQTAFMALSPEQAQATTPVATKQEAPVASEPTVTVAAAAATPIPVSEIASDLAAVLAEFKAASLEAEGAHKMAPDEYGLAPMVGDDAQRFVIPSLCADCSGRLFMVTNDGDRARLRAYYDDLAKASAAFFSWVFECKNLLLQINGDLPEDKAREYEAALSRACEQ